MSTEPGVDDLQIKQDLDYQRREWAFERAGWGVMLLLVVAALLGVLGQGPLSHTETDGPDGTFRLEYDRFLRHRAETELSVHLSAEKTGRSEVRLWLGQNYLDRVLLNQVTPPPAHVEAGEGRSVFVFRVADRGRPARIVFHIEPQSAGSLPGRAGLDGDNGLSFNQFVYP
jgi:hypothetical protein